MRDCYYGQGKRKRGRPRNNWRRSMLQELEGVGYVLRREPKQWQRTGCDGGYWWMPYAPTRGEGGEGQKE